MPPKKPEKPKKDPFWEFIGFLMLLYVLFLIFQQGDYYLHAWGYGGVSNIWERTLHFFVAHFKTAFFVASAVVSIVAATTLFYSYRRFKGLVEEDAKIFGHGVKVSPKLEHEEQPKGNPQWERVLQHANSINPSDWRLAIIEADIMLDEVLREKGFHGDTIGDRLKGVDKSDMLSLDNARAAHWVRNRIAHDGEAFTVNDRDTKRVISQYESVFKEFKLI